MVDRVSNCIGFAYHESGVESEEKYIELPTLRQVLRRFNRVKSIDSAVVIAVVSPYGNGPVVTHIAILDESKTNVIHRKGVGNPITSGKTNEELKGYLQNPESEVIYLVPKRKRK